MCNLFSNTMPADAMRQLFRVAPDHDRLGNQPPLPGIFPRHDAPVVRRTGDGARELTRMHWGFLMPRVSERTGEPILPKAVNNARDDRLLASGFWRESFERRRCLVPATAFAEARGMKPATMVWFGLPPGPEGARTPFAFAGFWRRFRGPYRGERVELDTFTIVTTAPNALVRTAHPDRMPVILPPEAHEPWLSAPPAEAMALLRTFPASDMRILAEGIGLKADPGPDRAA
jgi:putative SOS response-associated peptidase YedK